MWSYTAHLVFVLADHLRMLGPAAGKETICRRGVGKNRTDGSQVALRPNEGSSSS